MVVKQLAICVLALAAIPAFAASHCDPDEVEILSCPTVKTGKILSLCAKDSTPDLPAGYIDYRFGPLDNFELNVRLTKGTNMLYRAVDPRNNSMIFAFFHKPTFHIIEAPPSNDKKYKPVNFYTFKSYPGQTKAYISCKQDQVTGDIHHQHSQIQNDVFGKDLREGQIRLTPEYFRNAQLRRTFSN